MKRILLLCLISLLFGGCVSAEETLPEINIQGENPYYSNAKEVLAITEDDNMSGGKCAVLHTKSEPFTPYYLTYRFQTAHAGKYDIRWVSTSVETQWVSPYSVKINNGKYVRMTDENTEVCRRVSSEKYGDGVFFEHLYSDVTLRAGVNEISFQIDKKAGDSYIFYLDCIKIVQQLTLRDIAADNRLNILQKGKDSNIFLRFDGTAVDYTEIDYSIKDYDQRCVQTGKVTVLQGENKANIPIDTLGTGYYEIEAKGIGAVVSSRFSIIPEVSEESSDYFAVDVAGNWLIDDEWKKDYAKAIRLAGVTWVRERFDWANLNPQQDQFVRSVHYEKMLEAYRENEIKVLGVFHSAPSWTKQNSNNSLPSDLYSVYQFGRNVSREYADVIQAWEVWNEPDGAYMERDETGDQYAAVLKAFSIGAEDSGTNCMVSASGFAFVQDFFQKSIMQNQIEPYVDIFNYHVYEKFAEKTKTHTTFASCYQPGWLKCWASEVGTSAEETEYSSLREQAERVVQSAVLSVANGTDKNFWFVFPNYCENNQSFGLFSEEHTPLPGYSAMATMTHAIGSAEYAGKIAGDNSEIEAYAFQKQGKTILVYWSETPQKLYIKTNSTEATELNLMGDEAAFSSKDGRYVISTDSEPHYLCFDGVLENLDREEKRKIISRPTLNKQERIVLQQIYDARANDSSKNKGYGLSCEKDNFVTIRAYNFNNQEVKGRIRADIPYGWWSDGREKTISIPAFGYAEVVFQLSPFDAALYTEALPIRFYGVFDNEETSCSTAYLRVRDAKIPLSCNINGFQNAKNWSNRGTFADISQTEGGVRFSYQFADNSWAYPVIRTTNYSDYSGTGGLLAIVSMEEEPDDGVIFRAFAIEANQANYYTLEGYKLHQGENRVFFPWSDFTGYPGMTDDNNRLDPEKIRYIQFGVSVANSCNLEYTLNNFGTYKKSQPISATEPKTPMLRDKMIYHQQATKSLSDSSYWSTDTSEDKVFVSSGTSVEVNFCYTDRKNTEEKSICTFDQPLDFTDYDGIFINVHTSSFDLEQGMFVVSLETDEGDMYQIQNPIRINSGDNQLYIPWSMFSNEEKQQDLSKVISVQTTFVTKNKDDFTVSYRDIAVLKSISENDDTLKIEFEDAVIGNLPYQTRVFVDQTQIPSKVSGECIIADISNLRPGVHELEIQYFNRAYTADVKKYVIYKSGLQKCRLIKRNLDENKSEIFDLKNKNTFYIRAEITNYNEEQINAILYLAVYSLDGVLLSVKSCPINITGLESADIEQSFGGISEAYQSRCFLWEAEREMQPIA